MSETRINRADGEDAKARMGRVSSAAFEKDLEVASERNKIGKREGKVELRSVLAAIPPYAGPTPFKRLVNKLLQQIFQHLDTKSALNCRLVCRRWEGIIALYHTTLELPEACTAMQLRMLTTLFPKVNLILLPREFQLEEFDWSNFFSSMSPRPAFNFDKVGDLQACLSLARALRESHRDPELSIAVLTRSLVLVKEKAATEGEESLEDSDELGGDEVDLYFFRALAYLEGHKFQQALEDCDRALALLPAGGAPEIIALRGKALVELERYEEGLKDLDFALALEAAIVGIQEQLGDGPTFVEDWSAMDYRGEALRQLGRFNEAVLAFDKVLKLNPNHACSLHSRGLVKAELFQYHEAIEDFTKAIELEPHEMSYCERAWAYYRIDRYQNVIEDCLAIQELCGNKPSDNFYLQWTFALYELRRLDEAYEISLKAIEFEADDSLSIVAHAVALQGLGRYREALVYFDRALELHTDDDWALVRRTKTYCHFNRYNEALDGLSRSLRRFPNNRSTLYHRSYVYKKLGRYAEALADLDALEIEEDKLRIAPMSLRRQRALKRRKKIMNLLNPPATTEPTSTE